MSGRITPAQRIEIWSDAEREIQRYADDHYLWHKHVHNVELDSIQILKCIEMDKHPMTLDFSSRRMGKTAIKELYFLKRNSTTKDQELGIVAPREAQSTVNLGYHLDAIRRSEMLTAYIDVKQGRKQMSDTRYQFANRSKAQAYGIMANVDGGDLTAASLEEVDDMPHDRLFSRFLLMMGSARRLGADANAKNKPEVRITGVYKGADTLVELIDSGEYFVIGAFRHERALEEIRFFINEGYLEPSLVDLDNYRYPVPIGNAINGMQLGLLQASFIESIRIQLPPEEFARQLLCVNTASRNLIWTKWLQRAVQLGVQAHLEPVIPIPNPDKERTKRGLISLGYDHTGHGEKPEASKSAVVILEEMQGYQVPIFAKTWPAGTDESVIKKDLISFWRYFKPDRACGDAFGVSLIADINEALYEEGLITVNHKMQGESTASNWSKWFFSPLRFEGMTKHLMATALRALFSNGRIALPYVNHIEESDIDYDDVKDLQVLYRQLTNIEAVSTTKSYASYKMVKVAIGDDLFDALMAANWAAQEGQNFIPSVILLGGKQRENYLDYKT